jgi:hypothetical protein
MIQHISSSAHRRARRRHAVRHLETLEPRTLLSAAVSSYTLPGVTPVFGAYDSSGALWVYDNSNPTYGAALERIVNNAVDTAPGSVIPMDTLAYAPMAFAAGLDGHIYAADAVGANGYGAIDDINTLTGLITQTPLTDASEIPYRLTVTGDGAVWFLGFGASPDSATHTTLVGRMDPATQALATYSLTTDSTGGLICSSGSDSVWIGMGAIEDPALADPVTGTNRIAAASFDGSAISLTTYAVSTGDVTADKYNIIASVASDPGDGSVWFTLSNNTFANRTADQRAPDQIVHGVLNGSALDQTAYIGANTSAQTLNYAGLAFDAEYRLWFFQWDSTQFGYLDTTTLTYSTPYDNTTDGSFLTTAARTDGTQLSFLTSGSDIIQIDVAAPEVTFSGAANDINVREDTVLNDMLLATFTAPAPLSGYTATITWGDNTTSVVTPTLVPGSTDTYAVIISGKSFATQGVYSGTITVQDGSSVAGTLTFTSTISDIPLNVTSLTTTPLFLRIVTAVGTFTDDGDLALSTWKATINWGDNTTSTGLIVRDPTQSGRYFVLAIHQYRTRGTYTVRLTVTTSEVNSVVTNSTLTATVTAR